MFAICCSATVEYPVRWAALHRCGEYVWGLLKAARAKLKSAVAMPANYRVSSTDGDAGCIKLSLHDAGVDSTLRSLHNVCDIHGQNNAYKSQVKLHRGFCGHAPAILVPLERPSKFAFVGHGSLCLLPNC